MRERATGTLTTVIVDDEQLACDELAYLLRDFPEVEVAATGRNGLEAVQLIRKPSRTWFSWTSTCPARMASR
jgi:two-component system response regulator LytT